MKKSEDSTPDPREWEEILRSKTPEEIFAWATEHGVAPTTYSPLREDPKHTPLHFAAFLGRADLVSALIKAGADVNAQNGRNNTPIHTALATIPGEHYKIIDALLEAGANVNLINDDGYTPLHRAAKFYLAYLPKATSQKLIKASDNINVTNSAGDTPLHTAVFCNDIESTKILLEAGANINATNTLGNTPLHLAAEQGYNDFVELLLEHKANLEIINNLKQTPLHVAVERRRPEVVETLVQKGANVLVKDTFGRTPIQCVGSNKRPDKNKDRIREILTAAGGAVMETERVRTAMDVEGQAAGSNVKPAATPPTHGGPSGGHWK